MPGLSEETMWISKRVVGLEDAHDTERSATVYAETPYETVVRGLKLLEGFGCLRSRQHASRACQLSCPSCPDLVLPGSSEARPIRFADARRNSRA